ncbi:lamin tail domain-containing protein [Halorarum halobium]|uniref:lamin tail domain-containing protein n=1 Tax=Halorarum halobium TaxID=3075121 RepID=UPI0028A69814|nr:lamin tail domain-containing protein [Halobaculum sp. XH14]
MERPLGSLACCLLLVLAGCASVPAPEGLPDQPGAGTADADPSPSSLPPVTPGSTTPPPDGTTVTVVEVVDGDTVRIRYGNGTRDTARLLGVDTPEVYGENTPGEFEGVPDTAAGRSCLGEYGDRASAFADRRLAGEEVTVSFDANEPRRGYYDRLLVYVHHDGHEFNRLLVHRGLGRVYDSSFEKRDAYYATEADAMDAGRGLWTCRDGEAGTRTSTVTAPAPATGTPTSETGVVISKLHADAEGPDGENLTDEYVVVTNRGEDPVELAGWTLAEAAGRTYTFPGSTTLAAGESVTVHVGEGTDGDGHLYWGRTSPILNNDGETVTLRDASGAVVAERSG